MQYRDIRPGRFIARPNRFIALVWQDGAVVRAHVKNTGRCAELLVPGAAVYLEYGVTPGRATLCDLVSVEKRLAPGDTRLGAIQAPALPALTGKDDAGHIWQVPPRPAGEALLINMDSAAPNAAAGEWLAAGGIGPLEQLRAEQTVGDSRFDFTAVQAGRPVAVEVKGCTLEDGGVARFPDAPTQRGVKHLRALTALCGAGWRCCVLVAVQMAGAQAFAPNWTTHPAFGMALRAAADAGVQVLALGCDVQPDGMRLAKPLPVWLDLPKDVESIRL